jgi:hypothetical protein
VEEIEARRNRLEVTYDKASYSRAKNPNIYVINQGNMAFSEDGETSLASFAFSGCLGVVLSPTKGRGGLVYHVHQMRGEEAHEEAYIADAILRALQFARELGWDQVDMALVRGQVKDEDDPSSIMYPDLVSTLNNTNQATMAMVRNIRDLRARTGSSGSRPSELLLDTRNHVLHLWNGYPDGQFMMDVADDEDRVRPKRTGSFRPVYTKSIMQDTRWFHFK